MERTDERATPPAGARSKHPAESDFGLVIETGTYRADTTRFLAETFGCPVWTVEANRRFFTYSRRRLRRLSNVTVEYGDSRECLRSLSERTAGVRVFAYLDAHWHESLPLREEIETIARDWPQSVIMIDDFQVPDDPVTVTTTTGQGPL